MTFSTFREFSWNIFASYFSLVSATFSWVLSSYFMVYLSKYVCVVSIDLVQLQHQKKCSVFGKGGFFAVWMEAPNSQGIFVLRSSKRITKYIRSLATGAKVLAQQPSLHSNAPFVFALLLLFCNTATLHQYKIVEQQNPNGSCLLHYFPLGPGIPED